VVRAVGMVSLTVLLAGSAVMGATGPVTAVLNGLRVTLDADSGGLRGLYYDGPGQLLDGDEAPGLIDLAYPIPQFEPLRLATRYSHGAHIESGAGSVLIRYDRLGLSRAFALPGGVSATVSLTADQDGRSINMECVVENHSDTAVRQVAFPDFAGLLPVAGVDNTILKTGGFGSAPFRELVETDQDQFYAQSNAFREYTCGGMFQPMWMRWLDLGGLNGGLSLFPRQWGWDPRHSVLVHLSPHTGRLRLMCLHAVEVPPGGRWQSPQFVLTPHRQGWARGIEVYREFARAHIKREWPVAEHVRRGLGYRTAWMCQNQPEDPAGDAIWRFRDLPGLAREAKEHGLTEMVLWGTHPGFEPPLPEPFPTLGTEREFADAVAEARGLGVNVAPFISVLGVKRKWGARYGLQVPETGGWTYHTELVPQLNPSYAGQYACASVATDNPLWQQDVLDSCRRLIDLGITSISWDQYLSVPTEPNIPTLTAQIRRLAKAKDPESTFSGEELNNIEVDCNYLDYTWNWGGYLDCQAYTSVFPGPRRNVNNNHSLWTAYRCLLDNLYMNVFTAKPGGVNGSARISDYPDFSAALKRCARLREEFVRYFTDGTFLGNCVLAEPSPGVHVTGYVLPGRALVLVHNEGAPRAVTVHHCLPEWLPSPSGAYRLRAHSWDGELLNRAKCPTTDTTLTTPVVGPGQVMAYEFLAR
jgi:hypothetical protein